MSKLFCYGTLLSRKVRQKVLQDNMEICKQAASLRGFQLYSVRNHLYPAIAPSSDSSTYGWLLHFQHENPIKYLDEYEGSRYQRIEVQVCTTTHTEMAYAYVWKDSMLHLDTDFWNYNHFVKYHQHSFLNHFSKFHQPNEFFLLQ